MAGEACRRPVGELLPHQEFIQLFRAARSDLTAIRPFLATYGKPIGGEIELTLFRMPSPRRSKGRSWSSLRLKRDTVSLREIKRCFNRPIATLRLTGELVIDNAAADLLLSAGEISVGDLLALRIRTTGVSSHNAPTVWTSSGADRIAGHVTAYFNGKELLEYGVMADLAYCPSEPISNIPAAILYSPVTQCNLNCVHCISRDTRDSFNRLPENIKNSIRQWASDGRLTSLNTDYSGDILWANDRFGKELDFIFDLDIPFQVDTNGVYLTEKVSKRLCDSKMLGVNISLDAAHEDTYKKIRKGAPSLNSVISNVERLIEIRGALRADFRITLGFTLMASTLPEWNDFIKLAAKIGVDAINTAHLHAYTKDMEQESLFHQQDIFNEARSQALQLAKASRMAMSVPPPFHGIQEFGHGFCDEPWQSASVLGNGDVAACCVPGTVMGNLHQQTMEDIWTGPLYRNFRARINSPSPPDPCSICPMFRRVGNRDSYLQYSARLRSTIGSYDHRSPKALLRLSLETPQG